MGLPDVPKFVPGLVRLPRKYPGASIPGEMLAAVKLVSPAPPPVNELLAFEKVLIPVHVFAPDHDGRPVSPAPLPENVPLNAPTNEFPGCENRFWPCHVFRKVLSMSRAFNQGHPSGVCACRVHPKIICRRVNIR